MTQQKNTRMAHAIRFLSADAVQKANSGHPGLPMGAADIATVLFTRFMKFDPKQPNWPDRDRFVLSAGHGSMLLYSSLYLLGASRPLFPSWNAFARAKGVCLRIFTRRTVSQGYRRQVEQNGPYLETLTRFRRPVCRPKCKTQTGLSLYARRD